MELPIYLLDVPVIINGAMTATIHSISLDVKEAIRLSAQVSWVGAAPVGSILIEGSLDNVLFNTDPETIPFALSGASGSTLIKISNVSYPFVRLSYVFTSGTGTLNVSISAKRA
jgi:hypothetical protein